nr:Rh type B glycoprotein [Molgula manhattensis]
MGQMRGRVTTVLILTQIFFIVMFGVFVDYDSLSGPANYTMAHHVTPHTENVANFYPMYQDIHVMMLVGFGFLMTFLKRHGFGSVAFNFLLTVYVIEWSILVNGWFGLIDSGSSKIELNVVRLMEADFAVATVLITFGAVLGKVSPLQLLALSTIEVVLYNVSIYIGVKLFQCIDVGGAIFIHAFGAYFGLAVSFVLYKKIQKTSANEGSSYYNDIFAMVGTVFLWLYWPSFNAGPAGENERHRAIINTVLSLCSSTIWTFALSFVLSKDNKVKMVHIQNATLAGGVIMGASADLLLRPYGAMIGGSVAGIVSTLGYEFLQPVLLKARIHDTCGVHNLHGMPGILGAVVSAIAIAMATPETYKDSWSALMPAGRDASTQAGYQMASITVSVVLAIVGGLLTGLLLKLPFWDNIEKESDLYNDELFWDDVEDEHLISGRPPAYNPHEKNDNVKTVYESS